MPLTKLRRPKFERSNIKQELFSTVLSEQRLNKLQLFLAAKNLDALLIVTGIDGRFNIGCLDVVNFLLFDVFETRKSDIERSKMDDEVFDDIMVCIRREEVHFYCNGVNYWLLLPYVAAWPGLRMHCFSEDEMQDTEKLDEFKMECFIKMTKGSDRIGVITKSIDKLDSAFDPMEIENWPIVQSFGHDDFGRLADDDKKKGFFTMVHELIHICQIDHGLTEMDRLQQVIDISTEAHAVMRQLDPVRLEFLYQKVLPQMEGLFENIFQLLDTLCSSSPLNIDEDLFEEPVLSYFKHLQRQHTNNFNLSTTQHWPFTVTGRNTWKDVLQPRVEATSALSSDPDSSRSRLVTEPTHMVVQCVNGHEGLLLARTVFLRPHTAMRSPEAGDGQGVTEAAAAADVRLLSCAYGNLVAAAEKMILDMQQHGSPLDPLKCKQYEDQLEELLKGISHDSVFIRIDNSVETSQSDHGHILTIQAAVYNVRNKERKILGSVVFADSFVCSYILLESKKPIVAVMRVGKNIPVYQYWSNLSLSRLQRSLPRRSGEDPCGDVAPGTAEVLLTETAEVLIGPGVFHETEVHSVCCIFYLDRVVFYSKRLGVTILTPVAVEYLEGDTFGDWSVLALHCSPSNLPPGHWQWAMAEQQPVLHLVFSNRSRMRKAFNHTVLPRWREGADGPTLTRSPWDRLDGELQERIQLLLQSMSQQQQHSQREEGEEPSIMASLAAEEQRLGPGLRVGSGSISLDRDNGGVTGSRLRCMGQLMPLAYRAHHCRLDLSEGTRLLLDRFQAPLRLLRPPPPPLQAADCSALVTVLCGPPQHSKIAFGTTIAGLERDRSSWRLLQPDWPHEVANSVRESLSANHSVEDLRLVLLAPPMMLPAAVSAAVTTVDGALISGVCVCMDSRSCIVDQHECTVPGLLELCDEGFCQTIVIFGNDTKTESLARLVRARNDICSIFMASQSGEAARALDAAVIPFAWSQPRQQVARTLSHQQKQLQQKTSAHPDHHKLSSSSLLNVVRLAPSLLQLMFPLYGPLSRESIITTFQRYSKNLPEFKTVPGVLFIDGLVQLKDGRLYRVTGCPRIGVVSLVAVTAGSTTTARCNQFVRLYVTSDILTRERSECRDQSQAMGDSLRDRYLGGLLVMLQTPPARPRQQLDRETVTAAMQAQIHKARHLEPLPVGWFYNGVNYVSMDGRRSDLHPDLDRFIVEFLADENIKVDQFNENVSAAQYKDAFQPPQ